MNETTEKIKRPTSITVICVNSQKARADVDSFLMTNIPSKKILKRQ